MTAREQYIQDLRAYRDARESAEAARVNVDTLDVAAEVVALYENRDLDGNPLDKRWQDELDAPTHKRGRPMDPDSFERFYKWGEAKIGLKRTALGQLRRAHMIAAPITAARGGNSILPRTEFVVRPLNYLLREDKATDVPKVWDAAVKIAKNRGQDEPSQVDVRKALSEWKKVNESKPESGAAAPRPKGWRAKVRKIEQDIQAALVEAPSEMAPILRRVLSEYEAKVAAGPPVEEWSR
jgi:hypothetical protein